MRRPIVGGALVVCFRKNRIAAVESIRLLFPLSREESISAVPTVRYAAPPGAESFENHLYNAGMTSSVSTVEVTSPPTTTVASGL